MFFLNIFLRCLFSASSELNLMVTGLMGRIKIMIILLNMYCTSRWRFAFLDTFLFASYFALSIWKLLCEQQIPVFCSRWYLLCKRDVLALVFVACVVVYREFCVRPVRPVSSYKKIQPFPKDRRQLLNINTQCFWKTLLCAMISPPSFFLVPVLPSCVSSLAYSVYINILQSSAVRKQTNKQKILKIPFLSRTVSETSRSG